MQLSIYPSMCTNYKNQTVRYQNFGSAKDINLYYVISKRSHLLPERMKNAVMAELKKFKGNYKSPHIRSLLQLHKDTYAELASVETLADAKKIFPEFSELIDYATVADKFPRLTKVMKSHGIKPEDFSLMVLKKLWSPAKIEDICEEMGFANRTSLDKVLKEINMPRYDKNYTTLMKTSEEAGNRAVAVKARETVSADECRRRLVLANAANSTPVARAKHGAAVAKFYKTCPGKREMASDISRATWDNCPEIREAMSDFLATQSAFCKSAIIKKRQGKKLSEAEKRIVLGFYERFWAAHPELKKVYAEARKKAAKEVSKSWNA